jgi:hypothetical protein
MFCPPAWNEIGAHAPHFDVLVAVCSGPLEFARRERGRAISTMVQIRPQQAIIYTERMPSAVSFTLLGFCW